MSPREFFRRERISNGNHGHVGGAGCFDPSGGVFDDAALFGLDPEEFSGAKENIRSGFAIRDVLNADDGLKIATEIFERENYVNDGMVTAGSEAEFVNEREALDEFGKGFEDGLLATNHIEETPLFAFREIVERFGRLMLCDEVEPERAIRAAVILDDSVHVEDNGAEFLLHLAGGIYGKIFSSPNIEVIR
jgi:hypothetical protein